MYPRDLLANIGQFKKVRVQPSLANRILEKWLVRAGCATGYHHSVQFML